MINDEALAQTKSLSTQPSLTTNQRNPGCLVIAGNTGNVVCNTSFTNLSDSRVKTEMAEADVAVPGMGEDAPHEAAVVLVPRVPDGLLLGQGLGQLLPAASRLVGGGGGAGMSASCCEGSRYAAVMPSSSSSFAAGRVSRIWKLTLARKGSRIASRSWSRSTSSMASMVKTCCPRRGRSRSSLSVEGVFQMDYIQPERLVRPAFDLVLRRIHSPPGPCYMCCMCYIYTYARKFVVYVLYRAI